MKYIPENYIKEACDAFTIWHHPDEAKSAIALLAKLIRSCMRKIARLGLGRYRRNIHFCAYHSNATAREYLKRNIPDNMLMTPYSSREDTLIILHSASLQTDPKRITRHLIHELLHALLYELSGSEKELGDGNANLRLPYWLNEGIAEYFSLMLTGQRKIINEKVNQAMHTSIDYKEIDNTLMDVSGEKSELRSLAFSHSILAVSNILKKHKTKYVFQNLDKFRDIEKYQAI